MPDKITVTECTPLIWKFLIAGAAVLGAGFGAAFFISSDPLWLGIFRLAAFVCFAILVMSFFQTTGQTDKIELHCEHSQLAIDYYLSAQKSQEELFEIDTIDHIKNEPAPPAWYILPRNGCRKLVISFTDTQNSLSLFRFQERDLFVSPEEAQQVEHFLDENLSKRPPS